MWALHLVYKHILLKKEKNINSQKSFPSVWLLLVREIWVICCRVYSQSVFVGKLKPHQNHTRKKWMQFYPISHSFELLCLAAHFLQVKEVEQMCFTCKKMTSHCKTTANCIKTTCCFSRCGFDAVLIEPEPHHVNTPLFCSNIHTGHASLHY